MIDELESFESAPFEIDPQSAYRLVVAAITQLASVCDGAQSDDHMGYAKGHSYMGKRIAEKLYDECTLTPDELAWAEKTLPYYMNTQLRWIDKVQWPEIVGLANRVVQEEVCKQNYIKACIAAKTNEELKKEMLAISPEKVTGKSRRFFISLQNQSYEYTAKQRYYVEMFVYEYADIIISVAEYEHWKQTFGGQ